MAALQPDVLLVEGEACPTVQDAQSCYHHCDGVDILLVDLSSGGGWSKPCAQLLGRSSMAVKYLVAERMYQADFKQFCPIDLERRCCSYLSTS
jgi:hypothetical protein